VQRRPIRKPQALVRLLAMLREATTYDLHRIAQLLQASGLRTEGILEENTRYWLACNGPDLIGAIGLELGPTCALLRSAFVSPGERGKGIGRELTEHALQWAWQNGFEAVYCFSTDAGPYWIRRGFKECAVEEVVRELPDAPQVRLFDRLGWLPTEVAYRVSSACLPS
jgi:N-acetylglutamate synthase-like GNAT family acetyltransferase